MTNAATIRNLRAGPDMDAEVGRLMGLNLCLDMVPAYSTDLAAAWTVVERLVSEGLTYFILARELDGSWEVEWTSYGSEVEPRAIFARGATVAEAVCRGALALAEQRKKPR